MINPSIAAATVSMLFALRSACCRIATDGSREHPPPPPPPYDEKSVMTVCSQRGDLYFGQSLRRMNNADLCFVWHYTTTIGQSGITRQKLRQNLVRCVSSSGSIVLSVVSLTFEPPVLDTVSLGQRDTSFWRAWGTCLVESTWRRVNHLCCCCCDSQQRCTGCGAEEGFRRKIVLLPTEAKAESNCNIYVCTDIPGIRYTTVRTKLCAVHNRESGVWLFALCRKLAVARIQRRGQHKKYQTQNHQTGLYTACEPTSPAETRPPRRLISCLIYHAEGRGMPSKNHAQTPKSLLQTQCCCNLHYNFVWSYTR